MNSNAVFETHALDGNQLIANNTVNSTSLLAGQSISYSTTALVGSSRIATVRNNQVTVIAAARNGIDVRSDAAGINFFTNISGNQVVAADPARGILVRASNGAGGTGCAVLTGNTAPTFTMNGVGASAINMQQTEAAYNGANTATTGFVEAGTVNFGTGCTGP